MQVATGPLWTLVPTELFHNGESMTGSVMCTVYLQLRDLHVHGDRVATGFCLVFLPFSVKLLVPTYRNHMLMTWHDICLSSSVQV